MNKVTISICLLLTVCAFLLVLLIDGREQHNYKIGVLLTGENRLVKLDGMKSGLENLGYNKNSFEYVVKNAEDNINLLDDLAGELLQMDLHLIVTLGGVETQVMERKMLELERYVPTVFVGIAAPYELGLIEEYKSPGSVFTGVNNFHMNLSAKRLEMFSDLIPQMEKVYLLYSGGIEISEMSLMIVRDAAYLLGIEVVEVDLNRTGALKQLEAAITEQDGILTLPSYQVELLADEIASLALNRRVPTMGIYDFEVEAGYLFSYGSRFFDQGYQAARHVSLILQGNEPSHLPVELPDSINFIMNESVRQQLMVDVNPDIRKLAEIYHGEREQN